MADDNLAYHNAGGTEIDTASENGVRAALADIGTRLLALETAPHPASGSDGAGAGRLERIEAVVSPFFREALLEYDGAHAAKRTDAHDTAAPAAGTGGPAA